MFPTAPVPAASSYAAGLPTLTATDLACRRGNRLLFSGVNLAVRAGQATWLRGANGRGKTSLLRLAAGLAVPDSGQVTWGEAPVRRAPGYAQQLVFVAHTNALKDDLTVTESLRFLALICGRNSKLESVHAALQAVDMYSRRDALVRTLSQGQRRRASLARLALEHTKSIWILDEPFDALDDDGVQRINKLISAHLARGGSALLTSHQASSTAGLNMTEFDLDRFA
ncbi:MAG: cytochrome c biogenesis heme-transporting ATPase CcmA [Burkholderiaceae bacterium]|nr:cytochrome c biogenesis heme-transporting ATPase CcmA [Burkholderiaceae bacterium]